MNRREFLGTAAATGLVVESPAHDEDRTFATPEAARKSPRETLAYITCVHTVKGGKDYLATIDLDPNSKTFSQVIHRLSMPNAGDELHHFGWNACASCHGTRARRFLSPPAPVSTSSWSSNDPSLARFG